jgi:hypothetical protein
MPVTIQLAPGRPSIDDLKVRITEVRANGKSVDNKRTTITSTICDQDAVAVSQDEPVVFSIDGTGLDYLPHTAQMILRYAHDLCCCC